MDASLRFMGRVICGPCGIELSLIGCSSKLEFAFGVASGAVIEPTRASSLKEAVPLLHRMPDRAN